MYELIKEHAVAAKLVCETEDSELHSYWVEGVDLTPFLEEYTKSILEECLGLCRRLTINDGNRDFNFRLGAESAAQMIATNFGIKE